LDLSPVDGLGEWRRGMLRTRRGRDLEALECFGDVARHGQEDGAFDVVPIKGDTTVDCSGPAGCHFVFAGDDSREMFGMLSSHVLYSEVVD
jgi:hypothetical protein